MKKQRLSSTDNFQVRINYDDQLEDVMEKVNEALEEQGLHFVADGLEHDGFMLYTLAEPE